MKNSVLALTKKLIAIPSFVGNGVNEKAIADFIITYLQQHGFAVQKQYLDKTRYNIIVTLGSPKLWLCGHMDTVEPKNTQQLQPEIIDDKLYGLGAADMKGGIAAILTAVTESKNIKNLGLLFYCDEEYFFQGMKTFLKDFADKPELTIIAEPTNLAIGNAHRGIIELRAVIKGKTGHASRPSEGKNAIMIATEAVKKLTIALEKYSNSNTGITTCTLATITGGLQIGAKDKKILYANGTNSIPDTVEIALDIRPAVKELTAQQVTSLLKEYIAAEGGIMTEVTITQEFKPLLTNKNSLGSLEKTIQNTIGTATYFPGIDMGFGDGQLFAEHTQTPVVYFGPGPTTTCHQENEYVSIPTLQKTTDVFKKLIAVYGTLS